MGNEFSNHGKHEIVVPKDWPPYQIVSTAPLRAIWRILLAYDWLGGLYSIV